MLILSLVPSDFDPLLAMTFLLFGSKQILGFTYLLFGFKPTLIPSLLRKEIELVGSIQNVQLQVWQLLLDSSEPMPHLAAADETLGGTLAEEV